MASPALGCFLRVMVFKALHYPLGDIMIPKATLALMSEHGGVEMEN